LALNEVAPLFNAKPQAPAKYNSDSVYASNVGSRALMTTARERVPRRSAGNSTGRERLPPSLQSSFVRPFSRRVSNVGSAVPSSNQPPDRLTPSRRRRPIPTSEPANPLHPKNDSFSPNRPPSELPVEFSANPTASPGVPQKSVHLSPVGKPFAGRRPHRQGGLEAIRSNATMCGLAPLAQLAEQLTLN